MTKKFALFSVFGVELEYMVVHRDSLKIMPIVDELIKEKLGFVSSDVDNGNVEWSNELTAHVVEIKTNGPVKSYQNLATSFHKNVVEINAILSKHNAMLLPTAAHPFMNPFIETVLWQHDHNEVYDLYNRIFDCRGHGWSNLQSMHLNLPFANDEEFGRLHAAIRFLLPIIPALTASSPLLDGQLTAYKDARMHTYSTNQAKLPQLMGSLIPEAVFTEADYRKEIFEPIKQAIAPFDEAGIMDEHFLNSRGAIARFDRGAIEIRVMDLQECPAADIALAALVTAVLKRFSTEDFIQQNQLKSWQHRDLRAIFDVVIKDAENAIITDKNYLAALSLPPLAGNLKNIWANLYAMVKPQLAEEHTITLDVLLPAGSLSTRITQKLNADVSLKNIVAVYGELAKCLHENRLFV